MSAPISPGGQMAPERQDLGHHHDQQRTSVVASAGEPGPVARPRPKNRGSARRRTMCRGRRGGRGPRPRPAPDPELWPQTRQNARRFRTPRGNADGAPPDSTALLPTGDAVGHHHRLGTRGGAVIERGVGDLHAGQQRHLGLELEQILQGPLRHLGLVWGVGGQEFAALDQMIDRGRHMMVVRPTADKERSRAGGEILRGHPRNRPLDLDLAHRRWEIDEAVEPCRVGAHRRTARRSNRRRSSASISPRSRGVSGRYRIRRLPRRNAGRPRRPRGRRVPLGYRGAASRTIPRPSDRR